MKAQQVNSIPAGRGGEESFALPCLEKHHLGLLVSAFFFKIIGQISIERVKKAHTRKRDKLLFLVPLNGMLTNSHACANVENVELHST